VKTQNENGTLKIVISDNGIGMSKEVQRKVFDRFYRQEQGNVHNIKGHGLGLSYVNEILTLHNGQIMVDSTLGKGSTFTIELPLKTQISHE
jgi:two-component system phosphate regulon sensor histidine kinase PhoR